LIVAESERQLAEEQDGHRRRFTRSARSSIKQIDEHERT